MLTFHGVLRRKNNALPMVGMRAGECFDPATNVNARKWSYFYARSPHVLFVGVKEVKNSWIHNHLPRWLVEG